MESSFKNRIIVRSPNWLGDAIMAMPAMCCLQKLLVQNGKFCVVSPESLVSLYSAIPWVDTIISIGNGHSSLSREQKRKIKDFDADIGFLFVNSFRSAWYLKRGAKKLYGASNGIRDLLLTKSFKVNWKSDKTYETIHQSEKYLEMTYNLGCEKWDKKYPAFSIDYIPDQIKNRIDEFTSERETLVIAPGAAYGPAKRWSSDNYTEICKYWVNERKGNIIIVGSQSEIETAKSIALCFDPNVIINLAGKTSLIDLMYVLNKGTLCISNDSGVMHLGSALNVKGIAIFGSTDPYATGPLSKNWQIIIKPQTCSPCFARECKNKEKNYLCLNAISSFEVISVIKSILSYTRTL